MEGIRDKEVEQLVKFFSMAFHHLSDDPRNTNLLHHIHNYVVFLENHIQYLQGMIEERAAAKTTQSISHLIPSVIERLEQMENQRELSNYTTL